MAIDIESLVGADNMQLAAKEKVIQILHDSELSPVIKRYLYARWARLVGVQALPSDLDRVALWSLGTGPR